MSSKTDHNSANNETLFWSNSKLEFLKSMGPILYIDHILSLTTPPQSYRADGTRRDGIPPPPMPLGTSLA